ncbi:MAG: hypothetical protein NC082_05680 [Clostridiales bacterium]|nr:hypothetical protein [Clostridiales bacterium]
MKLAYLFASACISVSACSPDYADDQLVINPGPVEPPVTGQYGMERQDVLDYFSGILKGETPEYESDNTIASNELEKACGYVWDIWKTAVKRAQGEKLPTLSSHYKLDSWDKISEPDAIWKVPEGNMSIFYGSKGEMPADGYPLFMHLHGSGSDALAEWTASLAWTEVFNDSPSVFFVPKSPQGGQGTRWFQPSKQEKWEQLLRQALVSDKINPRKIYFMGISEGAYGSQRLASFYADYLAGAGPIAGGEFLSDCPPENLANVAFSLQTGENDTNYGRNLLTQRVNEELNTLQAAHPGNYMHQVELQAGKGHACDYTKTSPWLVNFTRNATPHYVYWENYGMGDINGEPRRYRDTFYNLSIIETSDDRSDNMRRTTYEMTITGNTINIKVDNVTLTTTDPVTPATGTINIGVNKTKTPATSGKLRVYLSNELVDLTQPVTINVNGKQQYQGNVEISTKHLVTSCALFFDPMRLFPAAVDVEIK